MDAKQTRVGILLALAAYFIWGIAPAYFKLIYYVPADEILTHRVIWSFFFMVALGLAFSFAFYGLLRKKIAVDAQTGMLFETLWLLPVAAIYLFGIADSPTSHMGQNPWSLNLLLMAAGVVTTIPLLCFTGAATRLRLSTLGFFQYIGPTLMFLLAVTFYGEVPGADKMVTFAFIWVALAIFVMDAIYTIRRTRRV